MNYNLEKLFQGKCQSICYYWHITVEYTSKKELGYQCLQVSLGKHVLLRWWEIPQESYDESTVYKPCIEFLFLDRPGRNSITLSPNKNHRYHYQRLSDWPRTTPIYNKVEPVLPKQPSHDDPSLLPAGLTLEPGNLRDTDSHRPSYESQQRTWLECQPSLFSHR